ncbi:MAG: TonB-dependent receptor [Hyphomonadaceae bacterium]|nr:TonB-dependent receptor [Hyphomonadaceae bacterium]
MFGKKNTFAFFTGVSLAALGAATPAIAQDQDSGRITDEIVVTAEKREASIQDVPIAISAFDEGKLDRLQINDAQDLLLAIPNFQFAKGNFTGVNIAIRGVGSKAVGFSVDGAVGVHINGSPIDSSRLFEGEFYDIQRVEVLRGPQGTLYGRNASAGVLNILTNRPELEVFSGNIEGTYGNYETVKARGFVNIPLGTDVAFRLAGFTTKRDGFITNVLNGNDIDNRDMYGFRASLAAEMSERDRLFFTYSFFDEDSNRSRIGKQLCNTDTRPFPFNQGCVDGPAVVGAPNASATLAAQVFALGPLFGAGANSGLLPLGANTTAGATIPRGFRDQATPFEPRHRATEHFYQLEYQHDFDFGTFTSLTSYRQDDQISFVDYNQIRGVVTFAPNAFLTTLAGPVPLTNAQGVFNPALYGDTNNPASNVPFTYDQSNVEVESLTQEFRFVSDLDGRFNYSLGGIVTHSEASGDYRVYSNTFTYLGLLTGSDPRRNFFSSETDPYVLDSTALFGEGYFNITDDLKYTLGLRYTKDEKSVTDRSYAAPAPNAASLQFGTREAQFEEITGRTGFDWSVALPFTEETNLYAFYSKGYKGGGINPACDPNVFDCSIVPRTFEPEFINAYEIGAKNILNDGRLIANLTGYYYDYEGLQISNIVNRTSVNVNVDAKIKGFEGEFVWEPINRLVFDLNAAYLDTEIGSFSSIDELRLNNNNPAFTLVKAFPSAANCVVNTAGIGFLQANVPAANLGQAFLALCTPNTVVGTPLQAAFTAAGLLNANGTVNTANVQPGIPRQLEGNELPNSPEYQVSFGAQYTFLAGDWGITPRVDYFVQADSFARVYNDQNDVLDGYDQWNASLTFANESNGLYANLFVRNIEDEDVITDLYLTDASSGLFRNAFLLEPRTYGITVGKRW